MSSSESCTGNISWPAVLKYGNDAELVYIGSSAEWDNNSELHDADYDEADCLIDSCGQIYTLNDSRHGRVIPGQPGRVIPLFDFLGLVKAHAAVKGSCCVAKLHAPSIAEAFKIIEWLEDE